MNLDKARTILGVEPGATRAELRAARNAGALKWHPDKNPGAKDAKERFEAIVDAFDLLVEQLPKTPEAPIPEPRGGGVQVRKPNTREPGIEESHIYDWVHTKTTKPLSEPEARAVHKQFFAPAQRGTSCDIWAIRLLARAMPTAQTRRVFVQQACKRFSEKNGFSVPCEDAADWIHKLEQLLLVCREHQLGNFGLLVKANKALPRLWPGDSWAERMVHRLQAKFSGVAI